MTVNGAWGTFLILTALLLVIVTIVAYWRTFTKAGRAGWKCLIPIYNVYILIKIAGKPGWWLLFYFIPFINIIFHLLWAMAFGRKFGKGDMFSVFLLWLLLPIGILVIGLGEDKYRRNAKTL